MSGVFASVPVLQAILRYYGVALIRGSASRLDDNFELVADQLHAGLFVERGHERARHTSLRKFITPPYGPWQLVRQCADVGIAETTSVHEQPGAVTIARVPAATTISRRRHESAVGTWSR